MFLNPSMKQLVMFDATEKVYIHALVRRKLSELPASSFPVKRYIFVPALCTTWANIIGNFLSGFLFVVKFCKLQKLPRPRSTSVNTVHLLTLDPWWRSVSNSIFTCLWHPHQVTRQFWKCEKTIRKLYPSYTCWH